VSSYAVADQLAKLNHHVHLGITDKSVGPRCIVCWRNKKEGIHKGGGAQQFYTGVTREVCTSLHDSRKARVPTISHGIDVCAALDAIGMVTPEMFEAIKALGPGADRREIENILEIDKANAKVARLPREPDEDLR
jgi:hypothetical protein